MENISPTHDFVLNFILNIKNGESIEPSIQKYVLDNKNSFCCTLKQFLIATEHSKSKNIIDKQTNIYRRTLLELLALGMDGHQILNPLIELEKDVEKSCIEEVDSFIKLLPFKMLLPLYLFIFPSYLIILIGPVLKELLESL